MTQQIAPSTARMTHTYLSSGEVAERPEPESSPLQRGVLVTLGVVAAVILIVNGAKRAGLIVDTVPLQLIAPLGALLSIPFLFVVWTALGRRAGATMVLAAMGLATTVGGEYVLNAVFPHVSDEVRGSLLAGPLAVMLAAGSVLFLVGMVAFAIGQWRRLPAARIPLALLALAAIPVAARSVLPPIAVPVGVWILAAAILWLTAVLAVRRTPTP